MHGVERIGALAWVFHLGHPAFFLAIGGKWVLRPDAQSEALRWSQMGWVVDGPLVLTRPPALLGDCFLTVKVLESLPNGG